MFKNPSEPENQGSVHFNSISDSFIESDNDVHVLIHLSNVVRVERMWTRFSQIQRIDMIHVSFLYRISDWLMCIYV